MKIQRPSIPCLHRYQGFVHAAHGEKPQLENHPYPSLDLQLLRKETSKSEVDAVFHLPLAAFTSPSRLQPQFFRGQRPYWTIEVADLVSNENVGIVASQETGGQKDEVGNDRDGRLKVWGLTGWYLSMLIRKLQIHED